MKIINKDSKFCRFHSLDIGRVHISLFVAKTARQIIVGVNSFRVNVFDVGQGLKINMYFV